MKGVRHAPCLLGSLLGLLFNVSVLAQGSTAQPQLLITYVETSLQGSARLEQSLQRYASELRRESARPSVALLGEIGRPYRMVVIEHWPDLNAATAERVSATLHREIDDELVAPLDRRVNKVLGPLSVAHFPVNALHMLMHVDVGPTGTALAAQLLQAQPVLSAPGALGYELGEQLDHPNHFAVHEVWSDLAAYEAYRASGPPKAMREQLSPVKGALYDDRLYRALSSPSTDEH